MDSRTAQAEAMHELAEKIHALTLGLALVDQRMETLKTVEVTMTRLDRLLVKVIGVNGDNGMVSELKERVDTNSEKLSNLSHSKAAFMGYAAGAAAVATLAVGAAMKYLP
jgi:hypothetical protein